MSKQEQTNTFEDGIMTDMHPLSANTSTMTDALNATIVTYNGNEMILQNDMGNTTLVDKNGQTVKLTEGFKPLGVVEHGGILYIASTNGVNFELGSFPGPSYNTDDTPINIASIDADYDLKTIVNNKANYLKDTKLYSTIPLYKKNENEVLEPCLLGVGQEFLIDVLSHTNLSNLTQKRFYKIRFINTENNQDITDLINYAITYKDQFSSHKNTDPFEYFPNIKNTTLGVRFELEDIDYFRLGQVDFSEYPQYNSARFPYFNEDQYRVEFHSFEYNTSSDIKINRIKIEWKFISKSSKNQADPNKCQGILGPIRLDSLKENGGKYTFPENIVNYINIPTKSKSYYFDYTIYPEWEETQPNEVTEEVTIFTKDHPDYEKIFGKWVIRDTIDLSISPSLWDSAEEYEALGEFNFPRYLSADLSLTDSGDKFKIGFQYEEPIQYDFLKNAYSLTASWKEDQGNNQHILLDKDFYTYKDDGTFEVNNTYGLIAKGELIQTPLYKELCNLKYFNLSFGNLSFSGELLLDAQRNIHQTGCLPYKCPSVGQDKYRLVPYWQSQSVIINGVEKGSEYKDNYQAIFDREKNIDGISKDTTPFVTTWSNLGFKKQEYLSWFGNTLQSGNNDQESLEVDKYQYEYSQELIQLSEDSLKIMIKSLIYFNSVHHYSTQEGERTFMDAYNNHNEKFLSDAVIRNYNNYNFQRRTNNYLVESEAEKYLLQQQYGKELSRARQYSQYNYWAYQLNIDENSGIIVNNDLKQRIQLGISKVRYKDNTAYTISNFGEIVDNSILPECILPTNVNDFEYSNNKSSYNIFNYNSQEIYKSSMGVLSPYYINSLGTPYTYVEIDKDNDFTYKFQLEKGQVYNMSFYLKNYNTTNTLEISFGDNLVKGAYIQGSEKDFEELEINNKYVNIKSANNFKYLNQYKLVQIIFKCQNEDIFVRFSSLSKNPFIIRNLIMFKSDTDSYRKAPAIKVFQENTLLVDLGTGYGDCDIRGRGGNYCYLPQPFYQIVNDKSSYTANTNNYTIINNKKFEIITS